MRRTRPLSAALLLAALTPATHAAAEVWTPPPAKEGYSYPECYCTNRGQKVPMGGLSCLTVGQRTFLARCSMSINNPIWREVQDGCPASSVLPLEPLQSRKPG